MHMKYVIFCVFLPMIVIELKMALGVTWENYIYEIHQENDENAEIFRRYDIARRDTRDKEPTKPPGPGVETEQRPPYSTDKPTSIFPTKPSSKKIEKKMNTSGASVNTTGGRHTINKTVIDNHKYYKSSYDSSGAEKWWYPLDQGKFPPIIHERLSRNKQLSFTTEISFQFPYYGHIIESVTITNKGYLFLGDVVHKFNASLQYVAPLMADFTTNNDTVITYVDTGNRLTVQWTKLKFQKVGEFSFQCTLLKNGTIIFAYRNIPAPVVELKSDSLQHRVGISDGLRFRIIRRGLFYIKGKFYKVIAQNLYFKYHSVELPMENVKTGAAYVITPLPNCVMLKTCDACANTATAFSCVWCAAVNRCSDGVDRHRQAWFVNKCPKNNQTKCSIERPTPARTTQVNNVTASPTPRYKTKTTMKMKQKPTIVEFRRNNKTTTKSNKTPTQESKITDNNRTKEGTVDSDTKITEKPVIRSSTNKNGPLNNNGNVGARSGSESSGVSSVGIGLIVLCLVIILVALCWFVYAYHHPHSRSGRFLIEHRNPKKWFRNSDGASRGNMHYRTKTMELSES
ncbi:plexin domain-containing protein 2-like [Dendronephthya gigantea]|uniref:plexin domain-containing protein 2-like n=1 Tax=Dendronephthya gigantea TaxID=151771 RepID=UPI00106B4E17|nr:plexin domain-containing protein 2-like [Dendronephthya gigantea]